MIGKMYSVHVPVSYLMEEQEKKNRCNQAILWSQQDEYYLLHMGKLSVLIMTHRTLV